MYEKLDSRNMQLHLIHYGPRWFDCDTPSPPNQATASVAANGDHQLDHISVFSAYESMCGCGIGRRYVDRQQESLVRSLIARRHWPVQMEMVSQSQKARTHGTIGLS